ncbi:retropepsin-like aspartic protease [Marinicella meishanensis]|uniref:retropepsin-like aspartic protease n=1 Tax=Marinicella meishanensis TaxID=2873263 RepID=UPI001CBD1D88|nr:retropepsin-like aspartic protease [Marinicella sp. NBU2979]
MRSWILQVFMLGWLLLANPASATTLTLSKLATGHDIIAAQINGVDGLFVVDTGAITAVNARGLQKFKIQQKLSSQQAAGAGGPIQIDFYRIETMSIGGVDVPIKQVGSTDLNAVTMGLFNATGRMIDGLIGIDVLMAMQSRLDVLKNTLTFNPPTAASTADGNQSLTVPLRALSFDALGFTFLVLSYEWQQHQGWLLVDSGASRTLIDHAALAALGLAHEATGQAEYSNGAGGGFALQSIPLDAFTIMQRPLAMDRVYSSDLSAVVAFTQSHTGTRIDGVIGQDFLQKYGAVIDVGEEKLVLKLP